MNSRDEIVRMPPPTAPVAPAALNQVGGSSQVRNAKNTKRVATSTDYVNAVKHYPVKLDTIKLKRFIANSNALDDNRLEEFVQNVSERQKITEEYENARQQLMSQNLRNWKDRDAAAMGNYDRYQGIWYKHLLKFEGCRNRLNNSALCQNYKAN